MGYTHYFEQVVVVDADAWRKITDDFRKLAANLPAQGVSGEPLALVVEGDQALIVDDEMIFFQGAGKELGYETFVLTRDGSTQVEEYRLQEGKKFPFTFCKTARRPYDLVVCATLIVVNRYAEGAYLIDSDGSTREWEPALEWVTEALGSGYEIPARVRE